LRETGSRSTPSDPASVEQLLDDALGALVAALTEMVVSQPSLRVRNVERRPVLVPEGTPDREVVVDCDWITDPHRRQGRADVLDVVLELELRRVCADHNQPVVAISLVPGADVGKGAQPVDTGVGAELDQHDLPAQAGRRQWL
jgi:hypothetical protein